jgi:hypothetical protein
MKPIPLKLSRGLNAREHHMARVRRVQMERAAVRATWGLGLRGWVVELTWGYCLVATLTRLYGKGCRDYDDDNLRGALKAVRDEVAAMLGVDDRDSRVRWEYRQRRSDDGRHWVGLEVRPLAPGQCPTCGHVEVSHG